MLEKEQPQSPIKLDGNTGLERIFLQWESGKALFAGLAYFIYFQLIWFEHGLVIIRFVTVTAISRILRHYSISQFR